MGNECPRCLNDEMKNPIELNSISNEDEKTYICSDCGINETRLLFYLAKDLMDKIPKEQLDLRRKFRERIGLEPHS